MPPRLTSSSRIGSMTAISGTLAPGLPRHGGGDHARAFASSSPGASAYCFATSIVTFCARTRSASESSRRTRPRPVFDRAAANSGSANVRPLADRVRRVRSTTGGDPRLRGDACGPALGTRCWPMMRRSELARLVGARPMAAPAGGKRRTRHAIDRSSRAARGVHRREDEAATVSLACTEREADRFAVNAELACDDSVSASSER